MRPFLQRVTKCDLLAYLELARRYKEFDVAEMLERAEASVRYFNGSHVLRDELQPMRDLENRWYESLAASAPDYTVYGDDAFIADAWACWVVYSRKYLRAISKVAGTLGPIGSVADLGNGISHTTGALKELFPTARVYGTNLRDTFQFAIGEYMAPRYGFEILEKPERADLVFASEYFEHFQHPLKHLAEVLEACQPRVLVIANAFGSRSVGHFDWYAVDTGLIDVDVSNAQISGYFNDSLRVCGFEKMQTGFWNDRPSVWVRQKE